MNDSEFYKRHGLAARAGFGQRPAVIVVDAILGFTDTASPLASDYGAEIAAIAKLLEAARGRSVPVAFSTVAYDNPAEAGAFLKKVPSLATLASGTRWVEVDPRLKRRSKEALIVKKFASCFFGTHLASHLAFLGVDTAIVTGFTTSGCVRATALDAMQSGFVPVVPRECVGDRASAPHEANLFDIDAKYGDVVTLAETLAWLETL